MTRTEAIPYVSYVVDDAGCGRKLGDDPHAIVREFRVFNDPVETHGFDDFAYPSVLVGWQCGFEPLFVAVHSYLDVQLTDEDAADMAEEYLAEIQWFGRDDGSAHPADYIIR